MLRKACRDCLVVQWLRLCAPNEGAQVPSPVRIPQAAVKSVQNSSESVSHSVVSDSVQPHGRQAPLSMGFSRQEYWSGLHALLQGIFPTQGSILGLLHCRQILYRLSHQGWQAKFYIFLNELLILE